MKAFFEAIQDFFLNYGFAPLNMLRNMELENWWAANTLNWIFMIIASVAFVYWMIQLKKYNDNGEEDKTVSSHSYL